MEEENKKIIIQSIEQEMKRSYIDYSMSVIVGRALPDARDGLKPVHRKIMYAMYELGMPYNRAHKKSARVVGDVIGKYHPHGDSAAYEAMVRMAQSFSLRYPLVDGQGNFGSVDGDSPAAMRYTEVRMSKIAGDLLADLDKDTADFIDNYDGSLKEPSILPAKFPNLLVNGSDGIAVGMATKMPPHNISEVCDAIIHVIGDPEVDVMELMQYIKGPDFPTGGTIYGINGIISAYLTGRGKIKVRANTHFEDMGNGKTRIIVDELPYQVNKSTLILNIAELVKNKVLEGITDLRDESDRDGMRMVIELHRDSIENVVLENLYKRTQMQTTYGIINLALVDNKPVLMGLKEIIFQFLKHRKSVVVRRTQFDLLQAENRYHVLDGLMKAFNMLDEAIELIRASKDGPEANLGLQTLIGIDEGQAKAILDMRLQKLTGLEIDSIKEEHNELVEIMKDLKDILANEWRVDSIIKDELLEMKETYGDERRTIINENALDIDEEDLIPMEEVVITISGDNYIKRTSLNIYKQQARGGVGLTGMQTKEEDHVENMFTTSSHDYLMFISNRGRLHWLKGYRVPEGSRQSKGKPIVNLLGDLEEGEIIVNTIHSRDFAEDIYLAFCTKRGLLKKTALSLYKNVRVKGIKAIKLEEGDELIETNMVSAGDQIILATKNGQACRFNESDVRSTGRDTIGVKGMTLKADDTVISMAVVCPEDKLLTVTENGFGKISNVEDYRHTKRGGKGVITIKTDDRNGNVVCVRKIYSGEQLLVTSKNGKIIRMDVDEIRETSRNTKGVKIMDIRGDDRIIAVQPIVLEIEEESEQ